MVTSAWVELKNEEDPDSPETPDTFWYYFEKDGKSAVSKWVKFDSRWYYFDEAGHMATGKTEIDGATYYLGTEKDGFMRTGWVRLEEMCIRDRTLRQRQTASSSTPQAENS